jgi:hypothetical protein
VDRDQHRHAGTLFGQIKITNKLDAIVFGVDEAGPNGNPIIGRGRANRRR